MTYGEAQLLQEAFCLEKHAAYLPTPAESHVGVALGTKGKLPINGLRHPPQGKTNGWYLWFGTEFSSDPHFFAPLCAAHLLEECPEAIRYLGLPAGYRFLIAGAYADIWFDEALLEV